MGEFLFQEKALLNGRSFETFLFLLTSIRGTKEKSFRNRLVLIVMKKSATAGLLPVGMTDVLPPFASFEAESIERIISVFSGFGYQRVSPPLLEFEETLFSSHHSDISRQTFRLTDPLSGRMMGVRADMTPQISRIATTRLKDEPRPLRLAYAGAVLRVEGTQLDPSRQVMQVGAELIGADSAKADAEIILLADEALKVLGAEDISFDLNLPTLFPALCSAFSIDREDRAFLAACLNQKDFSAALAKLRAMGKKARSNIPLFEALFQSYGDCERVLTVLKPLELPSEAAAESRRLIDVLSLLKKERPDLKITVDALENRGFEYHCGIGFSLFSGRDGTERGRGGRYIAGIPGGFSEPAAGVTLFMENVMRILEKGGRPKRVYVPGDIAFGEAFTLRSEGYVVVCGLASGDAFAEARRLSCDCLYREGKVQPF